MKFAFFITFLVVNTAMADQKFVCVSWMQYLTKFQEISIRTDGFPTDLSFDRGEWTYSAQVFEDKINYIQITNRLANVSATARSIGYPQIHLSAELVVKEMKSTVDCDIR